MFFILKISLQIINNLFIYYSHIRNNEEGVPMKRTFVLIFVFFFSFFQIDVCEAVLSYQSPEPFDGILPTHLIQPGQGKIQSKEVADFIKEKVLRATLLTPPIATETLEKACQPLQEVFKAIPPQRFTGDWREAVKMTCTENEWAQMPLFGYGSLLNPKTSKEFSASQDLDSRVPLLALGLQRSFTHVPVAPEESYLGLPAESNHILRLSAYHTKSSKHFMNGVKLNVDLGEELEKLYKREQGYDLLMITVLNCSINACDNDDVNRLERVFVLCTPGEAAPLDPILKMHIPYLYICLEGALSLESKVDKDFSFLRLFLETTYMPDGVQTLVDWSQERNEKIARSKKKKAFQACSLTVKKINASKKSVSYVRKRNSPLSSSTGGETPFMLI